MINDLVISQIRQRLEILYQMVDELETSGGGGGGQGGTTDYNELTNKPRINNVTLSGNRSLDDIGVSQAISDALTPVQTAISGKVDKVAGKGLSTNDFTNTDKANLSTALSKANAAAPQSTTYTKAQVNTALAAKLNIADVDNALSSTSTNPVQNKVVQAPIARLVNAGAKNKLNHTAYARTVNGVTYTVNADRSITITSNGTNTQSLLYLTQNAPLAAGSYILSGCTGGSTTKYDLRVKVGNTITNNYNGGTAFSADGTPIEVSIVVRAAQTLNITIKPMICTAEDYAISSEYVPYVKSNYQLTKDVRPISKLVDDDTKNILKNTGESRTLSGVTFTVNNDDSVTVTGTATGSTGFRIAGVQGSNTYADAIPIPRGRYTIYPSNSGSSTIRWGIGIMTASNAARNVTYIFDSPVTIDVTNDTTRYDFTLAVANGTVCKGETLYPMICPEEYYEISPEYVPYAPSNRELYEEVNTKASISDVYDVKPSISNGTDLNTMQTPGAYACGGATLAASLVNCPTTTDAFIMYVDYIAATSRIIQRLYTMNTTNGMCRIYIRGLYGGGWGTWYMFEGTAVT